MWAEFTEIEPEGVDQTRRRELAGRDLEIDKPFRAGPEGRAVRYGSGGRRGGRQERFGGVFSRQRQNFQITLVFYKGENLTDGRRRGSGGQINLPMKVTGFWVQRIELGKFIGETVEQRGP